MQKFGLISKFFVHFRACSASEIKTFQGFQQMINYLGNTVFMIKYSCTALSVEVFGRG